MRGFKFYGKALTLFAIVANGFVGLSIAVAADAVMQAPNVVPISSKLVTAGQPTLDALSQLSSKGFGAVINLSPPTAAGAIANEEEVVRRQGLEFVNIPVSFANPTEADFQAFVAAMNKFGDKKTLVHCQMNMRSSSMTFLYRVVVNHENPEIAYEAVSKVWSPDAAWKSLMSTQLQKAGVGFKPF